MVEGIMYPYTRHDAHFADYLPKKNQAFRRAYEKHKAENPTGLYYMTHDGQIAPEMEGTVDGVHMTDYGFRAYADILEVFIKQAVDDTGVDYGLTPTQAIIRK